MFGLLKKSEDIQEVRRLLLEKEQAVVVKEEEPKIAVVASEPFPDKPLAFKADPALSEETYARYSSVAEKVGFMVPEMLIERLKLFLIKHDLPVYELAAVVKYMDALAKRDNPTGYGWQWKPLRASDGQNGLRFGTPADSGVDRWSSLMANRREERQITPASDYFSDSYDYGMGHRFPTPPYSKVVPLHALERVALIEQEFGPGKVAFAVTDYATEPHVRPDPFLMAMVPNNRIAEGVGRFVIDVWDEPGFGIMEMVK